MEFRSSTKTFRNQQQGYTLISQEEEDLPQTESHREGEESDHEMSSINATTGGSMAPVLPPAGRPRAAAIEELLQEDREEEVETTVWLNRANRFRRKTWSAFFSSGPVLAFPLGLACVGVIAFSLFQYFTGASASPVPYIFSAPRLTRK